MSTIRVDNFGPSAGGTTYSARGIAKAWVNFNGTGTIAARDSENVSSLTDNGTGDYTVNLSNAFAAADYSWLSDGNTTPSAWNRNVSSSPVNASSAQVIGFYTHQEIKSDFSVICVSTHGDLA